MSAPADPGQPIAYTALVKGTPVFDSAGVEVAMIRKVLAVEEEDVLDGILVDTGLADTRFVNADQIGEIYTHRVELTITAEELGRQPEHEQGTVTFEPRAGRGKLADLWRIVTLRRLWRRDRGPGLG